MIEVLEPLEVGAGDTTSIDEHVRGAHNSLAQEDLLSGVGGGAIGTLEDGLDSDGISVSIVEGLLSGGGDHAVSLFCEELLGVLADGLSGVREADEGAVLDHVGLDGLDIQTGGVVDGGVVLNDSGDLTTVLLNELGGPVADSAESLDDEGLASNASGKLASVDEGLGAEELTDGVVDAETGGLGTTGNTSLGDELSSATALSVDIGLTLDVHVGVLDPGHGLLVGSHIGAKTVDLGTDEALLDQLHSVLTGHSLDLVLGVLAGVDLDTTLGTAEGDIGDGKFERHEGGEGLDFLQIDVFRVAGTTFDGELVRGVLSSIYTDNQDKVSAIRLNQLKINSKRIDQEK